MPESKPTWITREPVRFATLLLSLIAAIIGLLRVFDVALTDGQVNAVTELSRVGIEIAVFVVTGEAVRSKVSPTALLALLSVGLALSVTGCTPAQRAKAKHAVTTITDVAKTLCVFAVGSDQGLSDEQVGVRFDELAKQYCSDPAQIDPWIEPALAAQKMGAVKAGLANAD